MARLKERYKKEIAPLLIKKYGYKNVMEAPRVVKIVLNIGLGESLANAKAMEAAEKDLSTIAGQLEKKGISTNFPRGFSLERSHRGGRSPCWLGSLALCSVPKGRAERKRPRKKPAGT